MVLVNAGSSIGSHTLDLIEPPKLTSEVTHFPRINQKRFLRDRRSGKVKQICVLDAEDEYVNDIRSAMVFAEDERVFSSSSMDESVLDEKSRIERYTSQSWEPLKSNPHTKDLPEATPEIETCIAQSESSHRGHSRPLMSY